MRHILRVFEKKLKVNKSEKVVTFVAAFFVLQNREVTRSNFKDVYEEG